MTASYYLWKWADNDLPGRPNEVFSELLHGRMHPAIQSFDPAPVVCKLEQGSALGRATEEEWDWQVQPASSGGQASFIFLTCPTVEYYGQMRIRFCDLLLRLDISGYDEQRGRLMHCFLPKKNCWECGESDERKLYDITEDDLPVLLRQILPDSPYSYAMLINRQNHFVQCAIFNQRFTVEWHELYDLADFTKFGHWRAGYFNSRPGRQRLFVPQNCTYGRIKDGESIRQQTGEKQHELILYQDTLHIFRTFLRGEARPPEYRWQDIKDELP